MRLQYTCNIYYETALFLKVWYRYVGEVYTVNSVVYTSEFYAYTSVPKTRNSRGNNDGVYPRR